MNSSVTNNSGFASSAAEREGVDAQELLEWKEALKSVIRHSGVDQAKAILDELAAMARMPAVRWRSSHKTAYINTIDVESEPDFPGDLTIEAVSYTHLTLPTKWPVSVGGGGG